MTTAIQHSIRMRIWIFVVSLPTAYCMLLVGILPIRERLKELPSFAFPLALLVLAAAVDRLILKVLGSSPASIQKRLSLLALFVLSVAGVIVLSASTPP